MEAAILQKTPDLSLRHALDTYQSVYMASRNFAKRTRLEYTSDLEDLLEFLKTAGVTRLDQVTMPMLERYLADLDNRGQAGSTRRRKASSVRSFFSFLYRDGRLENNVALRLIPPRSEQKQPRVLTEQEYKRLLRACAHETRDAAIIELLLQTGIRLSELTGLTVNDIDLPARIKRDPNTVGLLHVRGGKGRKDRTLPLNYKACRGLRAYLGIRPQVEYHNLFINKFREPLGQRGVQKVVWKYLDEASIQGASVHSLRHTFGTHHVAKGTSLRTVQEALGHQDLKTTSVYVSLAREVMNKELQEHAL